MNKLSYSLHQLSSLVLLVVTSGLWLTSCAPYSYAEGQGQANKASIPSAYPPPGTLIPTAIPPIPTNADGSSIDSAFATPSPDEIISIAEISEVAPEAMPLARYSVESEPIIGKPSHWRALYIVDSVTGNRARLGDDRGPAIYGLLSDDYMLWFFLCDSCPSQGLHAYSLRTGKDILIAEDAYSLLGSVKISDNWVVYMTSPNLQLHAAHLGAYNLRTGLDLLITDEVYYSVSRPGDYFAVNENRVAWVTNDLTLFQRSVNVYDLLTQTAHRLPIKEKPNPRYLSVSSSVVIWWDEFWQGYDLTQAALFTIPVIPPGWENVPVEKVGPVMAHGNTLQWSLTVEGKAHAFTAPIVPKGQGPQATHVVPTPQRKPTVSPEVVTPTPIPLPTAYP